jgi:hypothetical protein
VRATLLLAAALAALALVAASGCGGDDDSADQATTVVGSTAGADSSTGEETSISGADAEELATAMLLRLSDFPTGWRAQPAEEEEDDSCNELEQVTEKYGALAKADSEEFRQGESTTAESGAAIFPDEETAREALNFLEGAIQSEEFRDCLNDSMREQAEEGVTFDEVQIGQVSFPALGERSSAWEVTIPAESQGISVTAYIDAVYIVEANAVSTLVFTDVFAPFDVQLREDLARTVAERMDTALAEAL